MGSLRSAIASAKIELNIEGTQYDPWFRMRAQQCLRTLNNPDILLKKQIGLDIDSNNRIKLPKDFYKEISIFVQVAAPNQPLNPLTVGFPSGVGMLYYLNTPFLGTCGIGANSQNIFAGTYEINGDYLQFFGQTDTITSATMCYMAYNMNDDGEMKLHTDWEQAIMYFLCYRFAVKNFKEYPQQVRQDYEKNWIAQANYINSRSQETLFKRMRPQLLELMNALIVDKNIFYQV
jgi:hypothetical protein